jgi:hypothetical protein
MELAFNFILILIIEILLTGYFFRRKKRKKAYMAAFLMNIITWPIVNIIILNTDWYDKALLFNPLVQIPMIIGEIIFLRFYVPTSNRKAIIMGIVVNVISILATYYIRLPNNLFQKKEVIITPRTPLPQ